MTKLADLGVFDGTGSGASNEREATVDDLRSVLADPEVQKTLGAERVGHVRSRGTDLNGDYEVWLVPLSRLEDTDG